MVFCLYIFMGFRFWPAIQRSLITFVAVFSSGLILAVVIFVPYLSGKKGQKDQEMKHAETQNEKASPQEVVQK